jgi:hypothetical protein
MSIFDNDPLNPTNLLRAWSGQSSNQPATLDPRLLDPAAITLPPAPQQGFGLHHRNLAMENMAMPRVTPQRPTPNAIQLQRPTPQPNHPILSFNATSNSQQEPAPSPMRSRTIFFENNPAKEREEPQKKDKEKKDKEKKHKKKDEDEKPNIVPGIIVRYYILCFSFSSISCFFLLYLHFREIYCLLLGFNCRKCSDFFRSKGGGAQHCQMPNCHHLKKAHMKNGTFILSGQLVYVFAFLIGFSFGFAFVVRFVFTLIWISV